MVVASQAGLLSRIKMAPLNLISQLRATTLDGVEWREYLSSADIIIPFYFYGCLPVYYVVSVCIGKGPGQAQLKETLLALHHLVDLRALLMSYEIFVL